jgi:hypothetical protein
MATNYTLPYTQIHIIAKERIWHSGVTTTSDEKLSDPSAAELRLSEKEKHLTRNNHCQKYDVPWRNI